MGNRRSDADKALDRRRNEAARQATVNGDRERDATQNLEEALRLQAQAQEFARAFHPAREARRG